MRTTDSRTRWMRYATVLALSLSVSCSRAPSFDIVGSFFPAWLICFVVAIVLTVLTRALFLRLRIPLAFPMLTYPSLTALFTFALWLTFYQ
jgi:hypothetical protein